MDIRTSLFGMCLMVHLGTATSLSLSCITNVIEVLEGRQSSVTCSGLPVEGTVQWIFLGQNNDNIDLGYCPRPSATGVSRCYETNYKYMIPSRTSDTESVLAIDFSILDDVNMRTLMCQIKGASTNATCQIDVVYPPEGTCSVQVSKDLSPWNVTGHCNITKTLSPLGRYTCQWYQIQEESEKKLGSVVTMKTWTTQSGGKYVSGYCEMPENIKFPTTNGLLTYKVAFTPGTNITTTISGIKTIVRPSPPTVSCGPDLYVPENTSISCTCRTQTVGTPGGYLRWSKGNNNNFNTIINKGIFDETTLSMIPQTLLRTDHNSTQFRCDVVWAENIPGNIYTASVGYILQPHLSINSSQNLTVMENQIVTLTCQAVGEPVPTVRLVNMKTNKQLGAQTSPMVYKINAATCEHTAVYTCIANNSMGEDKESSANLYINCKPRNTPGLSTSQVLSPVKYKNKREQQTFTVVAYPSPDNFCFIYLGPNLNLIFPALITTDISLTATCSPTQLVYVSTCTLTIDNVSFSDVGFWQLTIGNTFGSETFTFEVNVNAGITTQRAEADGKVNDAAVGGGVAAGVVIITIFIVISAVILKHRNTERKDGECDSVSLPTQTPASDATRNTRENKNMNEESRTTGESITYVELDFRHCKNNKLVKSKPAEQHVEYASIDFSKHTS